MSLINQMLKDLEARRSPALDDSEGVLQELAWSGAREEDYRSPLLFGLGLAAGLVLFGLGGIWLWHSAVGSGEARSEAPVARAAVSGTAGTERGSVATEPAASAAAPQPEVVAASATAPEEPVATQPGRAAAAADPSREPAMGSERRAGPSGGAAAATTEIPPEPAAKRRAAPPEAIARAVTEPAVGGGNDVSRHEAVPRRPEQANEPPAGIGVRKTLRPPTTEQLAADAYRLGVQALSRAGSAEAEARLRDALRHQPGHAPAREALVGVLIDAGRLVEARVLLEEGMQRHPEWTLLARLYARILAEQGENARALAVLERRPPELAADPDYHALLGALYQRERRYADAARVYRGLVAQRPGAGAWWAGLGLALDAQADRRGASEAFARALQAGALAPALHAHARSRLAALGDGSP